MPEYLEDIKKDHSDNFDSVYKKCKEYKFKSLKIARSIRMQCVNKGIDSLGFDPLAVMNIATSPETASDLIDQLLVKHGISVENWADKECEPNKKGIYIYKNGEIAFFISAIKRSFDNQDKRIPSFYMKTNVKFD